MDVIVVQFGRGNSDTPPAIEVWADTPTNREIAARRCSDLRDAGPDAWASWASEGVQG